MFEWPLCSRLDVQTKDRSDSIIPTDPQLRMDLPQELLDEILSHLPRKNQEMALRNCSLVARSWLQPSRRRLFKSVCIHEDQLQSWLNTISPANLGVLQHVRSIHYTGTYYPPHPNTGVDNLYNYASFLRLEAIALSRTCIPSDLDERMELFLPSQHSLSSLTLVNVTLPWPSFIAFVDYFPNIRNLELGGLSLDDNDHLPSLSRPLRGKLSFFQMRAGFHPALCRRFCGLKTEYDELVIEFGHSWVSDSRTIVTAYGKSLKRLRFHNSEWAVSEPYRECRLTQTSAYLVHSPVSLLHCLELRELEFFNLTLNTADHQATISSISSLNIRKIIFSHPTAYCTFRAFAAYPCWAKIDECMSALTDNLCRMGYKETLEVQFRFEPRKMNQADCEGFLAKFREKGWVKIVSVSGGMVLELTVSFFPR